MNKEQIELQNAITTTFLANLAFLSEYDNELYHRVDELSRMIENGTYKEKYALDFILENGEFDIYDVVNDKYLYNKEPKKVNKNLINKIQFDEKNSIFSLEKIYCGKEKIEIDFENRFNLYNVEQVTYLTLNNIVDYTSNLNDFLENKKKRLKKISKFIFMGTLLGRHIPKIAEKVDAEIYLVCERNLEIFRLSLFTVDYTILAKKFVIFTIMDNEINEKRKISDFLNIKPFENYLIKFSSTDINILEYRDELLSILLSLKPTSYDYNRYLYNYVNRTTKILSSDYKTLLMNKIKKQFNLFDNIPVLLLAAGPSLDENIEWIKKNQNKFFIVTIGAAYKKLLLNGIHINIIITLDEDILLDTIQFDDESVSKISMNTIIFASIITDSRILQKFNKSNLFLYEVFYPFHEENIGLSGFSVGEISLALLLNMNVKNLYLIGLDLALNQKTGESHFSSADSDSMKYNLDKTENDRSFFGLRESIISVKGNFHDKVYTTPILENSIKYVENFLNSRDLDVSVYNLSKNGAYFDNSLPMKIEDINIEDFNDICVDFKLLLELLDTNSLKFLSDKSKMKVRKELELLDDITNNEFIDFKLNTIDSYKELYIQIINFISPITDHELINSPISYILRKYLQTILPYTSYHFNDLKIKQEEKKVNKIKNVFTEQINIILNDYRECLARLIQ